MKVNRALISGWRRLVLRAVTARRSCLTLLASLLCCGASSAATAKPNVLFIVVDDLRPELRCYGATHIQSPNIDRLAARGMVFERVYCQVAVCNPSRSSVLSGARPDTTGVLDNQHFLRPQLPDVVTLPQHFKSHGYYSVSLGKVFHHSEREPGNDPQSWSEPAWYHGEPYRQWFAKESLDYIKRLKQLPEKERPRLIRAPPYEAANEPDDAYPDGQTAVKAIETLRRLKDRPFFLGVGFIKPHLPFTCPQKYWNLYPTNTIKLPDNYRPPKNVPEPALHNGYELRSYGTVPPNGPIPDEMALNLIRAYRACVSFVDAQIGRVIEELDRLGLRDNTIVILWGDHGYHLGEHSLWTKMTNFELGTHAPLILSVPGQRTAGQRTRALVEFVDIYPTLAELCGLPLPPHLEGTSFAPLLTNPNQPWKRAAFSQYLRPGKDKFMGRSIRTDQWRYTEWLDGKGRRVGAELYDHRTDPAENMNLASEPANQDIVAGLANQLHGGWREARPPGKSSVTKEISRSALLDRIYGGWTGMLIGGLEGLPHEFKYREQPRDSLPEFTFLANGARSDDDNDFEWPHLWFMDKERVIKLPYPRIVEIWKTNMNQGIWVANKQARKLMDEGVVPPETGSVPRNPPAWYNLSGQFCVESYGLIAPGMPQTAADIGVHYARVAVSEEPLQATQFWTSLISLLAFHEGTMTEAIQQALTAVDPRSAMTEVVQDAQQAFRDHPADWKAARQALHEKWRKQRRWNDNSTPVNGGAVVLALLYGRGDFYRTLQYAMALGYDADCNAATAGAVLGYRLGFRHIAALPQFKMPDHYVNKTRPSLPATCKVSEQAETLLRVAERVILANGGERISIGGQPGYRVRLQQPRVLERLPDKPHGPDNPPPKQ